MRFKLKTLLVKPTPQRVIAGLVFIPLLAYSFSPFRGSELSFPMRLVFWVGVMALAVAVTWASRNFVRGRLCSAGLPVRDCAFSVLIFALFTPALWGFAWLLFTCDGQQTPGPWSIAPYGLLFAAGLMLVVGPDQTEEQEQQKPRLARRLPETFEGEIYRLTVRNHSVDVVTSDGTFAIRMRFTDAIADMEPVAGCCTHRSHWVAESAIAGVEKTDGKIFLRLRNNDRVPVSRKYKPGLEQAGLL